MPANGRWDLCQAFKGYTQQAAMNVICRDYRKKCLNFTFGDLFTAVHLWAQVVTCLYCIQEVLSSNLV